MNEIFGSTYKVLFNLENSTAMHFPKVGRPVLVRKDAGRLSDYIGATTGAILDKVRGELEEAVIQDSILLDKVAAWTFALETGSMLERQRRYDAMSGNPAGADAKRMHRLLVAEQFARAEGSYNLFARAYDLVNLMGRYEQLNQDCVRSRGPQVKEPKSWRRTSPEYLPRSPGDV